MYSEYLDLSGTIHKLRFIADIESIEIKKGGAISDPALKYNLRCISDWRCVGPYLTNSISFNCQLPSLFLLSFILNYLNKLLKKPYFSTGVATTASHSPSATTLLMP